MTFKETIDNIRQMLEVKPEATVEAPVEVAKEEVKEEVKETFSVTEEQYNALTNEITSLKTELSEVKAAGDKDRQAFAKHGEVVNQLLDLVSRISDTPKEQPAEQPKAGFSRINKAEKEARYASVADSIKAMREQSIKN